MLQRKNRAKINFLLFLYLITVLVIFRDDLKLLFLPDPEQHIVYSHSFSETLPNEDTKNILLFEGFIAGDQGLQLAQGSSGKTVFSFKKKPNQGCLMRIWFYGDRGEQRPNAVKISVDQGKTYQRVTGSGNYIGTVFDLSPYVKGSDNFQIMFEAKNYSQFTSKIFDKIELVISGGELARPALPNLTKILGFLFLALMIFCCANRSNVTLIEMSNLVLLLLIILLAAYFRWNELMRIAGTIFDGDVVGYNNYAKKMSLFSDNGFYSAQFGKREPLYIFIVRLFFLVFGVSDTHLRFVSFVFSLVTVYLTYKIGKEWFNTIVGIIAAFIIAVHPYLISLSARGFRAEWFTTLLLLFIYYGYVKDTLDARWRVLITGVLIGCVLLTRSESLFMVCGIMIVYPLFAKNKWNYKMVLITLMLGVSLLMPHLYSIYEIHGTPFYTVNTYTRFYVNQEFMGKPGFPTRQEIIEKGMYTGTKITPIEYYFRLHTPWQFIQYTMLGFAKIYLRMPFSFFSGRGNLEKAMFRLDTLKNNFSMSEINNFLKLSRALIKDKIWTSIMGAITFITFPLGLFLMGTQRYWIVYMYLFFFQINTAFIAYLGLSERLTVHTYPLVGLCCGFALYWMYQQLREKNLYGRGQHQRS